MAERCCWFFGDGASELDPERKDVLGGKGASLAHMSRAGLPVPPGFTIGAECCPRYLDRGGRWPEGLEDEVRANLAKLEQSTGRTFGAFPKPLLVSVRSGAAVSMPGMMDTLLNCGVHEAMAAEHPEAWPVLAQFIASFGKTTAGIPAADFERLDEAIAKETGTPRARFGDAEWELAARRAKALYEERTGKELPADPWSILRACIEAVWQSWNSERAITYRKRHDVRNLAGTAVTVQAMFPSEVSGIVFTVHPNGQDMSAMTVESSYGLGEAVVSGDVHPDRFEIDRASHEVKNTVLGHKPHLVRALGDLHAYDPDRPSLSRAQLAELAKISLQVEAHFGAPVDLEFGWADGRFALLQARAIRGLEVARSVETLRSEEIERLRAMANGSRRLWVAHNLGETLVAPTPLTWDVVRRFMAGAGGFGRMYRTFGYRPARRVLDEGFLELICGRIYADPERLAELFWEGMPFEYDLHLLEHDEAAMDAPPSRFNPEKAGPTFFLRLPGTVLAMVRSWRRVKKMRPRALERFEKEILPPYRAWVKEKLAQDLTKLSTQEVLAELEARRVRAMDEFAPESLMPGYFGGLARGALEKRLVQLLGEADGKHLAIDLTSGLEGDLTVEQNELLFEVAQGEAQMSTFIERFGHRTVGEMELAEPRWREEPGYLTQLVAGYHGNGATHPKEMSRKNAERRIRAEAALPQTLAQAGGSSFLDEVRADLADAQRLLPYRENGKYYLMMGYELIRLAAAELGRRFDLGRDVFFLTLGELGAFEARRAEFEKQIAERKVRWEAAKRLEPARTIDSESLDGLGRPPEVSGGNDLEGDAVSAGVYTGPARVVFNPKEARDLGTGFVLVCPSTDPGWTALFVHCKGLVIERGGVLSHGAIVARDFGIPAVVCPGATRRIQEGATVRVDGDRGRVNVMDS